MTRQERQPSAELDRDRVAAYAATFLSRTDLYPIQLPRGQYASVRKSLSLELVAAHLQGAITLGAYALDAQSRAHWICLDADDEADWQGLMELAHQLSTQQVPAYLEGSRRGGHLWLFPDEPLYGREARRIARQLLADHGLSAVEIYPKQDTLRGGPGSLVRLRLGVHRKSGQRYPFLALDGRPLAPTLGQQVALLSHPARVPQPFLEGVLARAPEPKRPAPPEFTGRTIRITGEEVSDRIKNRITVYDFVSQFVELDRNGRGLCPFHDDHVMSFSVNREENYWHCFAGCRGCTVIDFWMLWRQIDFKGAVRELAALLL